MGSEGWGEVWVVRLRGEVWGGLGKAGIPGPSGSSAIICVQRSHGMGAGIPYYFPRPVNFLFKFLKFR